MIVALKNAFWAVDLEHQKIHSKCIRFLQTKTCCAVFLNIQLNLVNILQIEDTGEHSKTRAAEKS